MGRINAKKRNANASLPEAREAKRKKLSANHLEEDRRLLDSREKALERERALLEKEKSDFERQRKELEREKAEFKKQQDKMKKDKREYEKNQKEFQQEKMKLEKEKLKVGKLEKKAKKFKEVKLSMSRTLDKSKKEKRFLKKKFWKVIHSRNSWKSKRMPNKKSQRKRRKTTLTPRQELEFMVAFNITWSARKRMKSWMRKHEIDGTGVLQRANIEEAILMRMNNLNEAGRLKIRENNQTFACVIGDKGAKWTKIGIFFIDVDKSCDPRNIMLLSLYKGDDSAAALRKYCSDVFTQLCEIQGTTYYLGGIELTLMLMLGGDMSLEANVIGRPHVWSFNKFCLICKADKKMSFDMQFQAERMDFEPEMIIPSPLHVILGLATDYLKALEKIALGIDRLIYERMDQLLQSYGIAKQAWNHSWTGKF
uniref:Uncharacterized protein n=1 Tax=Acrobeloides nanus TaxID=290746 RepID=A0A914DK87_9BILA